jgi:hypothetical protein
VGKNDQPNQNIDFVVTKKRRTATKHDFLGWAKKVNAVRDEPSPQQHQTDQPEGFSGSPGTSLSTVGKTAVARRFTRMADVLANLEPPPRPGKTQEQALQRLAVDIPADLHAKIKKSAAHRNSSVREDITALLAWFYER